ncbi:FAD:protein FMN transferase [Thiocapsa bogorovii]|uniref:FAD:protein FMN transferase n=1 Tax=Thiocapsa bogorovii TaxID=521689 RepID=UPI001E5CE76D|nr:FAD:protein FMN transferase [Thiocapsa bogorovii]UHD14700.1 FAD:protein FMN transferase [Thiocapsa bogorovii]
MRWSLSAPIRVWTCLLMLLAVLLASGCSDPDTLVEIHGSTMGTTYSIKLVELPLSLTADTLKAQLDARLDAVNGLMSTYRPDSELSRFNASRSTDWFPVDPELADLVARAQSISALSDGAFDITVGPLVNLWGFGPDAHPFRVPDPQTIEKVRARVGHDKLDVRDQPPALRKHHPELYVDLSAIAKGYGVDQLADLLDRLGATAYLAEIGGELMARGNKPGGQPWRIAIERPDATSRTVYRIVTLEDDAMATSGDYRNFYEKDGQIYSHTIDPGTGRPVAHALASVTVITENCATADALATTFLVLGPERGLALAESLGIGAFFVSRVGDDYAHSATTAFEASVSEKGLRVSHLED